MSQSIIISYRYDGSELAEREFERDPEILWWCTSNPTWAKFEKVIWEDGDNSKEKTYIKSIVHTITIPVGDVKKLRIDDGIGAECVVQAPNQDGRPVGSKAGSTFIFLKDILDYQRSNLRTPFETILEFRLQTYQPDNVPFLKGRMTIKLENHVNTLNMGWKFSGHSYPNVPKMAGAFEQVISNGILRNLFPFDERAREIKGYFPPVDKSVDRVHAPIWVGERGAVPGMYFWVHYTNHPLDEKFYSNLARIALARNRMDPDDFMHAIEEQFSSNEKTISPKFVDALTVIVDMCLIPSTSLPYIGDFTDTGKRGKTKFFDRGKKRRVDIESFHDAKRMRGGDCEDLANLIDRVMTGIYVGMPELANKGVSYMEHGSWNDKILRYMQRVSRLYVNMGSLGSVVGAYLGQKEGQKMERPPIIHSEQDNNVELGAHMWWEWSPLNRVEAHINATNSSHKFKLFPNEVQYPWEQDLPQFVGEGTGYLSPLQLPISEYFKSNKEEASRRTEQQVIKINAMKHLGKVSKRLKFGQIQRIQSVIEDVPDMRITTFYREATHCYSNLPLRNGFNFGEFTLTQLSERISESTKKPESGNPAPRTDWGFGVSMRDRLKFEPFGLVVSPGYTETELHVVKSILRQFPPLAPLSVNVSKSFKTQFETLCTGFGDDMKKIVKGRKQLEKGCYLNVMFRSDDFSNKEIRDEITEDILSIKDIASVDVTPEIIADDIHNVRITIWMNDAKTLISGHVDETEKPKKERYVVDLEWKSDKTEFDETYEFDSQDECIAFASGIIAKGGEDIDLSDKFKQEAFSRGKSISQNYGTFSGTLKKIRNAVDPDSKIKVPAIGPKMGKSKKSMKMGKPEDDYWIERYQDKMLGKTALILEWESDGQGEGDNYKPYKFGPENSPEAWSDLKVFLMGVEDAEDPMRESRKGTGIVNDHIDAYIRGTNAANHYSGFIHRVVYKKK